MSIDYRNNQKINSINITTPFILILSKSKLATILISFLLSIIVGLNVFVDSRDRETYNELYNQINGYSYQEIFSGSDIGFSTIFKLASILNISFALLMAIVAYASIYLTVTAAIKSKTNLRIFFLLWSTHLLWLHNYTQIRVSLSISIFLYAIYCAKKYKILLLLIAVSIHFSVILPIIIYIVSEFKSKKINAAFIITTIILIIAININSDIVTALISPISNNAAEKINTYFLLKEEGAFTEQNLYALMPALQILITLYYLYRIKLYKSYRFELALSVAGPITFYSFNVLPVFAIRSYELFIPFFLLMLSKTRHSKLILTLIIFYAAIGLRGAFFGNPPIIPLITQ